ncbi:MAG: hypothetical protein J5848_06200 [Bacteroidales bacterium]|nr:hypothetical protein [Bacteroidales bacterium]
MARLIDANTARGTVHRLIETNAVRNNHHPHQEEPGLQHLCRLLWPSSLMSEPARGGYPRPAGRASHDPPRKGNRGMPANTLKNKTHK